MKMGRHAKILELIKFYPITTQEELLQKLKEEGYSVTQLCPFECDVAVGILIELLGS